MEKERSDAHAHLLHPEYAKKEPLFSRELTKEAVSLLEKLWRDLFGKYPEQAGLIVYRDQLEHPEEIRRLARKIDRVSVALFVTGEVLQKI